jgi:hypothetical protein
VADESEGKLPPGSEGEGPAADEGRPAAAPPAPRAVDDGLEPPQPLPAGSLEPGEVIRALARAARCFVMYDARNETVRAFLSAYREAIERSLAEHGALTYQVMPFDICYDGKPVYHEEDRERSLAFRLFRDGVRSVTLQPGLPWEEMLKLLEILSIRYTRIRLHEEDTLTLLRQAAFKSITFEVVEVFVATEENPEATADRAMQLQRVRPPPDWDQPLPRLDSPGQVGLKPIPEEALRALRDEASEKASVEAAVQVVRELLDLAERVGDAGVTGAVVELLEDVCRFFVVELRSRELCWTLREARGRLGESEAVLELCKKFDDAELLDRFLRDPDDVDLDSLMPLFAMVQGDHLGMVIDRFVSETEESMRRPLRTLMARLAMGKPESLLNRLGTVPPERVVDLFNVVCVVAPPERVIEAAYSLVTHISPEVQLGALEVLQAASPDTRFHETMQSLLVGPTPRVRVKAANIYGKRGGTKAYNALSTLLERLAKESLEPQEAAALGKGMFLAAREAALPVMRAWIHPPSVKGLMLRAKYGSKGFRMLRWAAVAGLAGDSAEASRALLTWLAEHSDEELARHCREAMGETTGEAPANG